MVAGYTYDSYVTALATLLVVEADNPEFVSLLPSFIDYAELRIYQDLDLLSTVTSDVFSTTTNRRAVQFPIEAFNTIQNVNILTPVGTANPSAATRNPCLPVTKEFLDMVYGSVAGAGIPAYFAMYNQNTILLGPWPDTVYSVEIVGTYRPESLSVTNTSTFISTNLPSLFMMASLIYGAGYQRNFGKMADDPQMAVSYESQYKELLASAGGEEARKKFASTGWTSMAATPAATPTRG
jgi:hypothetical protein